MNSRFTIVILQEHNTAILNIKLILREKPLAMRPELFPMPELCPAMKLFRLRDLLFILSNKALVARWAHWRHTFNPSTSRHSRSLGIQSWPIPHTKHHYNVLLHRCTEWRMAWVQTQLFQAQVVWSLHNTLTNFVFFPEKMSIPCWVCHKCIERPNWVSSCKTTTM